MNSVEYLMAELAKMKAINAELVEENELLKTEISELRVGSTPPSSPGNNTPTSNDSEKTVLPPDAFLSQVDNKEAPLIERISEAFAFCVRNEYKPQRYGVFLSTVISRMMEMDKQDNTILAKFARYVSKGGKRVEIKTSIADDKDRLTFTRFKICPQVDYQLFFGYKRGGGLYTYLLSMDSLREFVPIFGNYAYGESGDNGPLTPENVSPTANYTISITVEGSQKTKGGRAWLAMEDNLAPVESIKAILETTPLPQE